MGQKIPQPVYVEFVQVSCYKCSMPFWVPQYFDRERLEKQDTWYCPAGHGQVYAGETEAARLRRMLESANRQNTELLQKHMDAEAEKRKLERKLKRVHRGVCPQCNRTFQNLARHMECKHGNAPRKGEG